MVSIGNILEIGKDAGIFDFYLPFVLSFAIFYGLLEKSKIFGDSSKDKKVRNINVVVALSISLSILIFTPLSALIHFLASVFTQTFVAIVTLLSFIFIFYMLVPPSKEGEKSVFEKYAKHILVIAAVIAIAIFIASGGFGIFPGLSNIIIGSPGTPGFSLSNETILIIVLIVATIVIIWYLTREGGEKGKKVVRYKSVPVYEGEE